MDEQGSVRGSSLQEPFVNAEDNLEIIPIRQPSNVLSLKSTTTSQTVNQNSEMVDKDMMYCRSPADLIDIFSDIVDDLAELTGLSTLVAPLTDADPHTECIHGTIIDFLKNDLEEFLVERSGCDFMCEPECEKLPDVGAGEPEIPSPRAATPPRLELDMSLYTPTAFSVKSISEPPKKRKPNKNKIIAELPPPEEVKKGCCGPCTIV